MGWQLYVAGLLSGVFLSFLLYLGSLPPAGDGVMLPMPQAQAPAKSEPPKPRFDFYTLLPERSVERTAAPADTATPQSAKPAEFYLLQAGSFKQREDAGRRRAELLLLGLEPNIEETNGDNGRWYRVYLGPFQSRAKLNKARSLTAAQNIDTLLLKRRSG
ncbi:MAG: cell division protein FtsN [Halioglobus sp.]|jgi:cell division protein FtsN